jgi:hypothetical protein
MVPADVACLGPCSLLPNSSKTKTWLPPLDTGQDCSWQKSTDSGEDAVG